MDLGLNGRTFVVTAASSGLGLAGAQALAAEGANIVMVARRAETLAELADGIGEHARPMAGDLTDPGTPRRAVKTALEAFGGIDGALVSVGGPSAGSVLGTDDQTYRDAVESVMLPAVRVAREVVAERPDARLAFVLSSSARSPLPAMAPSNATRGGLAMLVSQLADEIGPQGGRAVGLMPGTIATPRIAQLHGSGHQGSRAATEGPIPLGRLGQPEEFGAVAAFMLSDRASYITGSLIPVDGGALRVP
ncbi:SDR family NAD(P)-dependent oxidoreductase [Acidipropionibacterium acidipropionici]|jgi:3-oxoacyl-[acyl-carrier protein] reductase|uniref:Oxidoreductase n=1 Tax=Acidipropionibacterium acidipropionici TaxID=1748 RepID=A0AAC9AN42_9ACTN|nr:SDR family oxidoreductase [Acidipropionibacterium acidipropionici]AMS04855.1 oxidoreductase [Acidipropionibacterium acidipropionici]AOZ46339.1 oxidoreductase [Acidipropionibacterium acidipropionici]AZP37622.1 SDR family NAD(P)-dependent oxidoreductase [Acidipropionibacterium acidipropionici]